MSLNKKKAYLSLLPFLSDFNTVSYKAKAFLLLKNSSAEDFLTISRLDNEFHYDLYLEESHNLLKDKLEFQTKNILKYLADAHYLESNGKIFINQIKLEEYQLLTSRIDTTPIKAFFLLEQIDDESDNNRHRFLDKNIEKKLQIRGEMRKRFKRHSDLHIHLGGSLVFEHRLHHILRDVDQTSLIKQKDYLFHNRATSRISMPNIAYMASVLENILVQLHLYEYFPKNTHSTTLPKCTFPKLFLSRLRSLLNSLFLSLALTKTFLSHSKPCLKRLFMG